MNQRSHFGVPHRKYYNKPKLCKKVKDDYFQMINDPYFDKRKIKSTLNEKYKIPKTTLSYWIQKWKINQNWDPTNMRVHGTFNRIFTDEQEANIVEYINTNYIQQGKYFSDSAFQTVAFEAFDEIYKDSDNIQKFQCSSHFIFDFKNRHRISSRLAHFRQRPVNKTQEQTDEEINDFKSQVRNLIQSKQNTNEPVINADETGFQILPTSIKTWSYKNTKNVVINVAESTKDRITIMSSITSQYEKLPLFVIGKGKDEETVEENLGLMLNNNTFTYSDKSYNDTNCFCQYLEFLRGLYPDNQTIHLIVDSYSSHTSKMSKQKSKSIKYYFIFYSERFYRHFTTMGYFNFRSSQIYD